jgi:DNA mismatch repair ATPase MutL
MGSHGSEIKPLGDDSIRRIVAEQAVTDLSSIVKELVDNALDAESSTVKGKLK